MPDESAGGQPRGPDHEKEKGHTKPMPHSGLKEFSDWVSKQEKPTPDSKGEAPPEAPQDQKEPREHGTKEEKT